MANDIKLQEGHPVDENLRPIKVGGKSTAIETAQHGNGARVNGPLEVTGDITGNVKDVELAGMILGYTRIQNDDTGAGDNTITVDTTMTVLETDAGTECKVTFVAPPSGNVEIQFQAAFATEDTFYLSVSTAASYAEHDEAHTYDHTCIKNDETDISNHITSFSITGLTAGTEYERWIAAKVLSGTGSIFHGRNRSTGTHAPPIIIKAIALPATIVTGE